MNVEDALDLYLRVQKFIKNNWGKVKEYDPEIIKSISQVQSIFKKLESVTDEKLKNFSTKADLSKGYLVHFPDAKTLEVDGNYLKTTKNIYEFLKDGDFDMTKYSYTIINGTNTQLNAIPVHSTIIKAINRDLERTVDADFPIILTTGLYFLLNPISLNEMLDLYLLTKRFVISGYNVYGRNLNTQSNSNTV